MTDTTVHAVGTLSAVVTRADGTVEDLGVISTLELPADDTNKEEDC